MEARLQHLSQLSRSETHTRFFHLQLLYRPQAVIAVHERVFALHAGHSLTALTTRAHVEVNPIAIAREHCCVASMPMLAGMKCSQSNRIYTTAWHHLCTQVVKLIIVHMMWQFRTCQTLEIDNTRGACTWLDIAVWKILSPPTSLHSWQQQNQAWAPLECLFVTVSFLRHDQYPLEISRKLLGT